MSTPEAIAIFPQAQYTGDDKSPRKFVGQQRWYNIKLGINQRPSTQILSQPLASLSRTFLNSNYEHELITTTPNFETSNNTNSSSSASCSVEGGGETLFDPASLRSSTPQQ